MSGVWQKAPMMGPSLRSHLDQVQGVGCVLRQRQGNHPLKLSRPASLTFRQGERSFLWGFWILLCF